MPKGWNRWKLLDKPFIITIQSHETPNINWRWGSGLVLHYFNLLSINSNPFTKYIVAKEFHGLKTKLTLRKFILQLSILDILENYFEMTSIILLIPQINQYVINEYNHNNVKIWLKYSVHKIYEHCSRIDRTKRHNKKLIMTIMGNKCSLRNVTFPFSQLMIARSKVNLRKARGNLKFIKRSSILERGYLIFIMTMFN